MKGFPLQARYPLGEFQHVGHEGLVEALAGRYAKAPERVHAAFVALLDGRTLALRADGEEVEVRRA